MPLLKSLLGTGTAPGQAEAIMGRVTSGLTAAGTTQTDALLLATSICEFTTVASGAGTRMPANLDPGDKVYIYNAGANTLSVYPPTGEYIQSGAINAAFSVGANKSAIFIKRSSTKWMAILSA
jgi:hypothetical protein